MRYFYAELDGSNVVKCVLETDKQLISDTLIQIDFFDVSLFGKTHIGGGEFENLG
jgi:hypothetical protein